VRKLFISVLAIAAGGALPFAVAAFRDSEDVAPRISVAEFQGLYATGDVVVIDVRNPLAFKNGHIRGALSVPLRALAQRRAELAKPGLPIVTYCRCPEEATSLTAARHLLLRGVEDVRALEGGYDAWLGVGGAIEEGAPMRTQPSEDEQPPATSGTE
jgi:rhodanese-related sulfurtransferase